MTDSGILSGILEALKRVEAWCCSSYPLDDKEWLPRMDSNHEQRPQRALIVIHKVLVYNILRFCIYL